MLNLNLNLTPNYLNLTLNYSDVPMLFSARRCQCFETKDHCHFFDFERAAALAKA
jgi:hypothetical protein